MALTVAEAEAEADAEALAEDEAVPVALGLLEAAAAGLEVAEEPEPEQAERRRAAAAAATEIRLPRRFHFFTATRILRNVSLCLSFPSRALIRAEPPVKCNWRKAEARCRALARDGSATWSACLR